VSGRTELPSGLVTFLFTDIEGSTRLARMLGTGYHPILGDHRMLLRRAMSTRDGTELFTEGDSFFIAFSSAAKALEACLDAQRALAAHPWPSADVRPRVRMGLHTGFAVPVGGEYASAEVHRAARVAAAAHGGQILCSAATARHADGLPEGADLLDLGQHTLRGFDDRERLFQLVAPGLERSFPRPRTPSAASHNLPAQVTSFVGRRAERRELTGLLDRHRFVTVVGTGGAGKTRLALQAAEGVTDAYPDGVWFVDVAAVAAPADLPAALASALGLRPEPGRPVLTTVMEYGARRRMLLVLDTCDTFPAAAADLVVRLLGGAPEVQVLATSREPLGVHGELVWRVPQMASGPGIDGDGVALLAERAAAARGGRACTPEEIADLERVVKRLDGLPLAIELAAARLRLMPAAQLADRLGDVLGTLDPSREARADDTSTAETPAADTPAENPAADERTNLLAALHATARHASLQATVGWSYRTLGPMAAGLLRRLAVFAAPVDLATVEWFGAQDALEMLSVLVDKSLLHVEHRAGATRYRLTDPVRAYAVRRLAEAGAEEDARAQQVSWSLDALRATRIGADGRPRTLSVRVVDGVAAEWRAAVAWSASHGTVRNGLLLAEGLDPWWREHGRSAEARHWFHRLYARLTDTGESIDDTTLASAYLAHAGHAADAGERVRFLQRAEALARRADDAHLLIRALAGHGVPMQESGRAADAEQLYRSVVDRAERLGVPGSALPAVTGLAQLLWRRGALDEAAELLGAARPVEAARPQDRGLRTVDMMLGMVALRRGDLVAAHDHLVVALRSRMRYGFRAAARETVHAMAVRCATGGDASTAALLFGAARGAESSDDRRGTGVFAGFWAAQQAALRVETGDAVFDAAYANGARLTLDQAMSVALSVEHPDLAADSTRFVADARTLS
jgi:predicted ATPase/class 3 adenylate cyclase